MQKPPPNPPDSSQVSALTEPRIDNDLTEDNNPDKPLVPDGAQEPDTSLMAQLREANQQLILATLRAQEMTETAEQAHAQMSHMAQHDYLTGLPNRALLNDRLEQAITHALRQHKKVALLYIDVDHFKHINDSLGHTVGDELLKSVAERLLSCVRHSDTISRQGGDEFILLLSEIEHSEDAAVFADKLINVLADPHILPSQQLHITLSIGISVFPDDGSDAETLIRNADTAMYHAKEHGRNNFQYFTQDMNERAVERLSMGENLRRALKNNEFVLHYQPKVSLETGDITGAEALLRWQHPDRGLLYPEQFVSIAEDFGLIVPIGRWALKEACRQMRSWRRKGLYIELLAINISAVELRSKGFVENVRATIVESGVDPTNLEFELTESVLVHDADPAKTVLRELKDMGLQIAIDDFGTGYSSLSYLRNFPIDTLKVDQSFLHDISIGSSDAVIVSSVIAMGKSLNQQLVAEGVETLEQLQFLQSEGCDEGQGYLFSQPLIAEEFARLLKNHDRE
ncbi:MAG TPA: EAL domain-containing protein [Methylophilaceae bacterium]|nr:EAL domain-containing protein [Methylophilaceae bacterium]